MQNLLLLNHFLTPLCSLQLPSESGSISCLATITQLRLSSSFQRLDSREHVCVTPPWSCLLGWTFSTFTGVQQPLSRGCVQSVLCGQSFQSPWIPLRIKRGCDQSHIVELTGQTCVCACAHEPLVNEWRRSGEGRADGAGGGCDQKNTKMYHCQPFSSHNMNGGA